MTKVENSKLVVGLDVGSHKVVAVVGELLPDGVINVQGFGICPSAGVLCGGIVDLDAAVGAISRAIEQAEYMVEDITIVSVVLSISGAHIASCNETGQVVLSSNVKQEDVDNALHIARSIKLPDGTDILHIIPQEYNVDRFPPTKNPLNLAGNRLTAHAHLIACNSDWLRNLKNAVEISKYKIDQVVFSGLASSYSVLTEDEKELGVCLIDIGGGTTDILVYINGSLRFSKVMAYGSNNITDYIAKRFATSRQQAESMIINHGSAIYPPKHSPDRRISVPSLGGRAPRTFTREQLSKETAECYYDIFCEIRDELSALQQQLIEQGVIQQKLIAGIVLTGGGSQIEDIVECAKYVLQSEVRVGYPMNITGLTDYVNKPQYATVLGLLQFAHHNDVETVTYPADSVTKLGRTILDGLKKTIKWTNKQFFK